MVNVQPRPQHVVHGITLIVGAMFVTSVQDVVFKLFSGELTLWQIFALRGVLAVPLLFALALGQGIRGGVLIHALRRWTLLRSIFITLLFLAFYAAIPFVSLSTLGAGTYVAPIFVTLLSAYVISEPVGLRGWVAVLIGFAGVIILLQPGTDAFSFWAILPVVGAFFYALAHIITRTKCQAVSLATMALSLNIVMLAAGLIVTGILLAWQPGEGLTDAYPYLLGGWASVGVSEWLVLGLLAILTATIGLGIAGAYQAAPPPIVATFEYCYLVFVVMWDYLFFATPANGATILGMALIIGAGMMVLGRR